MGMKVLKMLSLLCGLGLMGWSANFFFTLSENERASVYLLITAPAVLIAGATGAAFTYLGWPWALPGDTRPTQGPADGPQDGKPPIRAEFLRVVALILGVGGLIVWLFVFAFMHLQTPKIVMFTGLLGAILTALSWPDRRASKANKGPA